MAIDRSALAWFLASVLVAPTAAAAHPDESIGFEFEEHDFVWPTEEYHRDQDDWPTCRDAKYQRVIDTPVAQTVQPQLEYAGDEYKTDHHCDLEIELGPFSMANLNDAPFRAGMFDQIQTFM